VWGRSGAYRILVGKVREGGNLEDPDVNGRIILQWVLEKRHGGMDWIDLVQDRGGWRALVIVVMNLRVP
jgi:hypothetical protein